VPVLDLDAFLEGVDELVQLLPDGPALNFDPALGPAATSNGEQERRHSELLSQSRHAFDGQVYMVYGASDAATAPRHSRPESFNDIVRQHIGRPDRILRELQFLAPALWPMADTGATVIVVWDTELTANFRAQSHALRSFQVEILSLTALTNQGHVVRIGGPTSGIFVAGRRDIFIPLFKDDRSGYYVLSVKAPYIFSGCHYDLFHGVSNEPQAWPL
jgi:hypothetical protein